MTKTEHPPESEVVTEVVTDTAAPAAEPKPKTTDEVEEIGGPKGPDPTRFGDWSVNGRCYDF